MLAKFLLIGTVIKPQGIHGQVKIKPVTGDPRRFLELSDVLAAKEEGGDQLKVNIADISVREDFVYANLAGCASRNGAEEQRGWLLYVRREDAVELDEDENFITDLVGCKVVNLKGDEVGVLREILQPGANDVYVIALSAGGTLLLPALKRAIPSVDVEQRLITINETLLDEVAVFEN